MPRLLRLQTLLAEELKLLLDAESQWLQALPDLTQAARSLHLARWMEELTERTFHQHDRLLAAVGPVTRSRRCRAMTSVIRDLEAATRQPTDSLVGDVALMVKLQPALCLQVCAYRTAHTLARILMEDGVARLLARSLVEEERDDQELSSMIVDSCTDGGATGPSQGLSGQIHSLI
ncbi:DUF892 family protein [Haloferula sargassicola]|uniref:DUF892 family protein n=1 Tax=Haloferula sargassicola TaxID=490096 RepID=A0ABP9UJV7_9BACT